VRKRQRRASIEDRKACLEERESHPWNVQVIVP
jgi:hypothetical protein